MRLPFHLALAGAIFIVVLGIRVMFGGYYLEQRHTIQRGAAKQRTAALSGQWMRLTYTNLSDTSFGPIIIANINWDSLKLTPLQQKTLRVRINEVMSYLSSPDFPTYFRLKRVGFTGSLEPSTVARQFLPAFPRGSVDDEQLLLAIWKRLNGTNSVPPFLAGLSPQRIRGTIARTNTASAVLNGGSANGFTAISESLEPGFRYGGQANIVSSDSAHGEFFHLSFFARSSTSNRPGPVYISFYWSEPDQNWALSRMFADKILNLHIMF